MKNEQTNNEGLETEKVITATDGDMKGEKIDTDSQNGGIMDSVKNFLDFSFETIRVVIVSLIIIFVVRSFIIQPFFVKGSSMEPNFEDGDYLIVNEIGYRLEEPKRGDVIIFRYPNDPSEYFIKRIIGLPGETIQISDGAITIFNAEHPEGFVLDESRYLLDSVVTTGSDLEELGEGEYYVLGDNRGASSDSRRWGVLEKKYIIGKAWVRAWPFDSITVFESQDY
jgi:signal peptidase I